MEKKNERKAAKDFASGIIVIVIGILIIIDSLNMKVFNTFLDAPGFFPVIVGGVIIVLGGALAFIGFRLGGAGELKEVMNVKSLKEGITGDESIRVLILIALMFVYIWVLLGRMHFILSTSIYLTANFLYLKATKHWWVSLIIAAATSTIVYYAFKLGFGITMP